MLDRPYLVVPKGWGREIWLANSPMYCGKILEINPGKRTSLHYHQRKHETLYLREGRLVVWLGDGLPKQDYGREYKPIPHLMEAGSLLVVPPYLVHAFECPDHAPAILFEVSTQHFEDDSVRVQKGD